MEINQVVDHLETPFYLMIRFIFLQIKKNVSKQIEKNNNVCIVAYDNENWIRINCNLIDDSANIDAKKAIIEEFDWAIEEGYTLDNPDFQVLYIANAVPKFVIVMAKLFLVINSK